MTITWIIFGIVVVLALVGAVLAIKAAVIAGIVDEAIRKAGE